MPFKQIEKRLQSSGLNSSFHYDGLSFREYMSAMEDVIKKARLDLTPDNEQVILAANAPREYVPPRKKQKVGVLLIHGLLESPYIMHSLFEHFSKQGFLTRSLLLPGHGTVPGDLLDVTSDDWMAATRFAIASCRREVDKLFIAGYSTGAALALYDTYLNRQADGLILFAPVLRVKNAFARLSGWHHTVSWAYPNAEWFFIGCDKDYAKYQSIPYNAIHQVCDLTKRLRAIEKTETLKAPVFMVLTADDEIIDNQPAIRFFQRQEITQNRMLYYTNQPSQPLDGRIVPIDSYFPEEHILNFSHTCLAISPDHPHYGRAGDFHDFRHYLHWWGNYEPQETDAIYAGAILPNTLKKHYMSRLHYNPSFPRLLKFMDAFLKPLTH